MTPLRGPIGRTRDGGFRLRLGAADREALRALFDELRELLEEDDASVARLYPAAHPDDPEANADYERLARDGLVSGRLAAVRTVDRTLDADRLSEAELNAWTAALNDLRLVVGTRLGVTEELYETGIDPLDPRAADLAVYGYLTWLQAAAVDALSASLDDVR